MPSDYFSTAGSLQATAVFSLLTLPWLLSLLASAFGPYQLSKVLGACKREDYGVERKDMIRNVYGERCFHKVLLFLLRKDRQGPSDSTEVVCNLYRKDHSVCPPQKQWLITALPLVPAAVLCILILLNLCIQPLDELVRTTQALMQSLQTAPSSNHPSSQVITNVNQGSDKTSSWIMNSSITSAKYIVVNKVLWSACSYRAVPFVGGTNVQ